MDYLQIQKLIQGLDTDSTAERLMQANPDIDSTRLMSPMGFNHPSVYTPTPAEAPLGDFLLAALSGVQSGMQAPQVQLPTPSAQAFGAAQLAKPQVGLPEPPQGFGHLMFANRRS